MDTIEKAADAHGIDPALLAAIGLKESNWNPNMRNEVDGAGVGVGYFQITVRPGNGISAADAMNTAWAADWAANLLSNNLRTLANTFPKFTGDQLLQATAASYNFGTDDISVILPRSMLVPKVRPRMVTARMSYS